uniref:Uncharacterized protein n=1 Tax=Oncorhynchus kisutch TaxID=8019 RepID=A0A8C7J9H9_ONCKI
IYLDLFNPLLHMALSPVCLLPLPSSWINRLGVSPVCLLPLPSSWINRLGVSSVCLLPLPSSWINRLGVSPVCLLPLPSSWINRLGVSPVLHCHPPISIFSISIQGALLSWETYVYVTVPCESIRPP